MWKKVKRFLVEFDRAIIANFQSRQQVVCMSDNQGLDPGSFRKRSLSLGSNTSGGSPSHKKVDSKKTPTKMASRNPGGFLPQKPGPIPMGPPTTSGGATNATAPNNEASGSTSGAAGQKVPTLDKLAIDILPTYAQKAKEGEKKEKKVKDQFPWALYAFGFDGLSPISGKTFWTFQKFVNQKWLELPTEERKWILIEFWDYSDTFGVIAALDRYSTMWIKSLASIWVSSDGQRLKCFNRWERAETTVYKTFLRGPNWKKERSGSSFLNDCLAEAGLTGYKFTNLIWEIKPKGVYLSWEPEPSLAAELNKTMMLHMYGVCIRLKTQSRKSLSEKEWFEQLGYQEDLKGTDKATEEEEQRLLAETEDDAEEME